MITKIANALLKPAAFVYELGSNLRLTAYNVGYLKRKTIEIPVISIGNLTCGGTGKSPIVIDLAKRLIERGHKVAIVSRGYKRKSKESLFVVSDGQGNIANCMESGDEPYMMAKALPEAIVIVSAQRSIAAEVARKIYDASIILLDDGFQHLAIARNHDIVLVDYEDDLNKASLLPHGRLREPVSGLKRAQYVVITKVPREPDLAKLKRLIQIINNYAPHALVSSCRFVPESSQSLAETKVFALCAIAKPRSFFATLSNLKANIVGVKTFPDHHWFTSADLQALNNDFKKTDAQFIITTQKDAVRLEALLSVNLPIQVLKLKVEWLDAIPAIDNYLPSPNMALRGK